MLLILGDAWRNRRKIPYLVTDWFGIRPFQDVTTSSAMIGDARNDIVTLFRGNKLAAMPGVSFLAALFPLLLALFWLRFWPCMWMLSTWRDGRVLRRELLDFFFQFFNPGIQFFVPGFQLGESSQDKCLDGRCHLRLNLGRNADAAGSILL